MASEKQYIAKGNYRRAQIGHFLTVKNYIFLRDGGGKRLLLRFENGLGVPVDGMSYTVVQYDAEGNTVARSQMKHGGIEIPSGGTYAPRDGVSVEETCVDFEIVFSSVTSGRYTYRVIDRNVSVYYNGAEESFPAVQGKPEHSVKRRAFGNENARLAVLIAVLLLIALNIMNVFSPYRESEKNTENAETYETTDDVSETTGGSVMNFDDGERYAEI